MRIYEYESKELLKKAGVTIPRSGLANSPEQVGKIVESLNCTVVLKPQTTIKARGKAGLIAFASNEKEAIEKSKTLFGRRHGSETVDNILVEEKVGFVSELYLGIIVNYTTGQPVVVASSAGGIEIEKTAKESPEMVARLTVTPSAGLLESEALSIASKISANIKKSSKSFINNFKDMILKVYNIFKEYDCEMIEINPIGLMPDSTLIALDGAIIMDDDALSRHQDMVRCRGQKEEDFKKEQEYKKNGWTYLKMDGDIGILSSGAGITMAILDLMSEKGGRPGNFLDTAQMNREGIYNAFKIFSEACTVKTVLVNIFAGLNRCDELAEGIKDFITEKPPQFNIVVRMIGNREKEGKEILKTIGVQAISSLEESIDKAIAVTEGK
jgi:succinyl-CoA synthetase beta subunit